MNSKDAYIEHLENTIKDLQNQISNLNEIVLILRKEKFGSSSEKTPKDEINGQLSLFNETEMVTDEAIAEPIVKDVKGYKCRNSKTKREERIKELPVREVPCTLPDEEQFCNNCGTPLKVLGTKVVREELEYIPAKLQIVRYTQAVYECPKCKHTDYPFIAKADAPTSLMNHSLASPSSVANVMYQKCTGQPFL